MNDYTVCPQCERKTLRPAEGRHSLPFCPCATWDAATWGAYHANQKRRSMAKSDETAQMMKVNDAFRSVRALVDMCQAEMVAQVSFSMDSGGAVTIAAVTIEPAEVEE